jgi:hypothetical protein
MTTGHEPDSHGKGLGSMSYRMNAKWAEEANTATANAWGNDNDGARSLQFPQSLAVVVVVPAAVSACPA